MRKVVFCFPTVTKPFAPFLKALKDSVPFFDAAGWEHFAVSEVGNPYISSARNTMLRKALDTNPDVIVFLDHDLSWRPEDLLKLVETEGDYVAGFYRFKKTEVEYMGQVLPDDAGYPVVREDGCISGFCAPAGFLKITPNTVDRFMRAYPELVYGKPHHPHVDLFNHGAHKGVWYGEDYAFSRNWRDCGGEVWILPDVSLAHHTKEDVYEGNFHEFLLRQPGGSEHKETEHGSDLHAA